MRLHRRSFPDISRRHNPELTIFWTPLLQWFLRLRCQSCAIDVSVERCAIAGSLRFDQLWFQLWFSVIVSVLCIETFFLQRAKSMHLLVILLFIYYCISSWMLELELGPQAARQALCPWAASTLPLECLLILCRAFPTKVPFCSTQLLL